MVVRHALLQKTPLFYYYPLKYPLKSNPDFPMPNFYCLQTQHTLSAYDLKSSSTFLTLLLPLLRRIKIKDDNFGRDTLAAWACIRLDRLRMGYRFVHLLNELGRETKGVLLMRFSKKVK